MCPCLTFLSPGRKSVIKIIAKGLIKVFIKPDRGWS